MAKKMSDMQVKNNLLDAVKGGASIATATKSAMQAAKPKRPKMGPSIGKAKPGPKNPKGMKTPKAKDEMSNPLSMVDKDSGERNDDNEEV